MQLRPILKTLAFVVPALSGVAINGAAQQSPRAVADSGIVRGTVVAEATGHVLAYAIVEIPSLKRATFANDRGQFVFGGLPTGKFKIKVRQLGFRATERDVAVGPRTVDGVRIELARITQIIPTLHVIDNWACKSPGISKKATLATLTAFEQLEQNAQRMRLLQEEFPFEVSAERLQVMRAVSGTDSLLRRDTIVIARPQRVNYNPGNVLYRQTNAENAPEYFMQVPTLLDFADKAFQNNHCFVVAGIDSTHNGDLRIDFKPLDKLKTTDIAGSIFLNAATYQVRNAEFRMTSVPATIVGTRAFRFSTVYNELAPGLPVVDGVYAVTELDSRRFNNLFYLTVEEQSALGVKFFGKSPEGIRKPDQTSLGSSNHF